MINKSVQRISAVATGYAVIRTHVQEKTSCKHTKKIALVSLPAPVPLPYLYARTQRLGYSMLSIHPRLASAAVLWHARDSPRLHRSKHFKSSQISHRLCDERVHSTTSLCRFNHAGVLFDSLGG